MLDLTIVMAIAVGFSIGGFMVLGFEALRNRAKRKRDIQRAGELAEKYPVFIGEDPAGWKRVDDGDR